MIVRILGEGQWDVAEDKLGELNKLDDEVEAAIDANDEKKFSLVLDALLNAVRTAGTSLPDDSLKDSDLILPPADATIEEVRDLLSDEGLIPG
jgi:hypothetical protein